MRSILLTLMFIIASHALFSQAEISGTVIDTAGSPLPVANVVMLQKSDSLLTAFGTTDNKGQFLLKNIQAGEYILRITFLGYERSDQILDISDSDQYLGLGDLKMYPAGYLLSGVEVTADKIPLRMVGDTMIYNAAAFAVGENAVVEDLLRRLPGITVNPSGQITWRGKAISEVMVNGKPFFAGSTTLLTQNLDAKAIENVEVFDKKTDHEIVSGIDDGTESHAINLEMKEDFKAKVFGNANVGYGTKDRYKAELKGFRISDAVQIGLLGTLNNINKVGFSFDKALDFNSNIGKGYSIRSDGIPINWGAQPTGQNRSIAGGVNIGRSIGKDGNLTAEYSLMNREQQQIANSREVFNILGEERNINTYENGSTGSYRHVIRVAYRQKIDTVSRINFTGSFNFSGGDNDEHTQTLIQQAGASSENYTVMQTSENERPSGHFGLEYTRRLNKLGRVFAISGNGNLSKNDDDLSVLTDGLPDDLDIPGSLINGLQLQDQVTKSHGYNFSVGYTEPLSEKIRISLTAEVDSDIDEGDYQFRHESDITSNILTHSWTGFLLKPDIGMSFGKDTRFNVGFDLPTRTLKLEGDEERKDKYTPLLPYVSLRLRSGKAWVRLSYHSSMSSPGINRLQTIARPGSSGQVSLGNPDLDPSYNHDAKATMWFNDQFRGISANIRLSSSYTDNAFGNSITVSRGQQIYKTINVDHSWRQSINLGSTLALNFINSQLNVNLNASRTTGEGFVNNISQNNIYRSLSSDLGLTTEFNEKSFLSLGYNVSQNKNYFKDDAAPSVTTVTHKITANFELEISPIWRFESTFGYSIYERSSFTDQTDIKDLSLALELRPLKNKGHFIRLTGNDLFDQNLNVVRDVTPFRTTETSANVLGRYFMASFFYKF